MQWKQGEAKGEKVRHGACDNAPCGPHLPMNPAPTECSLSQELRPSSSQRTITEDKTLGSHQDTSLSLTPHPTKSLSYANSASKIDCIFHFSPTTCHQLKPGLWYFQLRLLLPSIPPPDLSLQSTHQLSVTWIYLNCYSDSFILCLKHVNDACLPTTLIPFTLPRLIMSTLS